MSMTQKKIPVSTIEYLREAARAGVGIAPSMALVLLDALEGAYDDLARIPSPSAKTLSNSPRR